MPLQSCSENGKSGYRWGQSGKCYFGPDAKKNAIKQGIAIEKPAKFKKIMDHDKTAKAYFGDRQTLNLAKAVYDEYQHTAKAESFYGAIASYFSKADDGQNSSDTDRGSMLVENGSPLSNQPKDTGDGSGNEFNKPIKKQEGFIETSAPGVQASQKAVADPQDNNDAQLDKDRKHAGHSVIPPYNDDASPETNPAKQPPDGVYQEPPTRKDMETPVVKSEVGQPEGGADMNPDKDTNKFSMGDVSNANIYQDKKEEAEASTDWKLQTPNTREDFTKTPPGDVKVDKGKPKKDTSEASVDWKISTPNEPEDFCDNPKVGTPKKDTTEAALDWDSNHPDSGPSDFTCDDKGDTVYDPQKNVTEAAVAEYLALSLGYISEEERKKVSDEDFAGPHKSFPIRNSMDIRHAAMLLHHSSSPSSVKKKIIEIAKRKNLSLPDSWKPDDQKSNAGKNLEWEENAGKNGDQS